MTEETNSVESVFKQGEETLQEQIAVKAIGLVKPMLQGACGEISNYLGDCEKVIFINKTKKDSPVGILILDTSGDFQIKGKSAKQYNEKGEEIKVGQFGFTGDKSALLKYYTAEEFVELLLTGRLKELTEKLLK